MTQHQETQSIAFLVISGARLFNSAFEKRVSIAGLELTPGEARTLLTIAAINGSRQTEIAARIGVEPMTLCAYLDRLESLSLVERQQDQKDRRSKRVFLAPASTVMLKEIRIEIDALITQATKGMTKTEVDTMHRSLTLLNSNLQNLQDQP
ncbi:MarR family winged helix-turn-helix transcriptional regulator [Agrobacterium sp. Azo12]|uniref:MarR family winged helix-turn-helix transcriptional regulator n=1 Tax=Agrobacterium sp. Azo12 TaxID=3031129 RepID=UPI0023D84254|nr:MarR family winged helix-turn-helix transcriptional regulator [Agrobacterium sp. Azo12]MDO5893812.1 MarR family winged helix-turn-helix transcriptional regulator [Agrobacterium sp. Azo12]